MKISRRNFFGLTGLGAIGAGLLAANCTVEPGSVVLEEQIIALRTLPPAFQGYRIGFLSDIHYGITLRDEVVEEAIQKIDRAGVDLLLLGGDYIWIPRSPLANASASAYGHNFQGLSEEEMIPLIFTRVSDILTLKRPKDGILAVYGNHDRWEEPILCRREFEQRGATFLINSTQQIKRGEEVLTIIGSDDYWTGIPEVPKLAEQDRKRECRILLSHNPDYVSFLIAREKSEFDLALCGHTHGGQIVLPGLGPTIFNIRDERLESGLYRGERELVYTTRGIGTVEVPFRLNCPPEATVIELRQA